MNRILFVDDDQNILQGIRRMLRPMRQEWIINFANNALQALSILEDERHDAIVSDTCMPGMNGIELLNEVKELYPNMIRIGLSGNTDDALALQSTKTLHQQLNKPCTPEELKNTISKSLHQRTMVRNKTLNKLITETESLPALPRLYQEITEIMGSKEGSLQQVGKLVAKDVAITAKILQLVNSAFFGLARHIGSPQEAVTYLGFDVIRGLVLTIKLFNELDYASKSGLDLEQLWAQSFTISGIAKKIAILANLDDKSQDYAQMAGMLHDIGILIMAANMPDEYNEVIKIRSETKLSTGTVEQNVFGSTHALVGGSLLGIWGLPDPIVEAVTYHHAPSQAETKIIAPLTAVHIATVFCWQNTDPSYPIPIDQTYLKLLGLDKKMINWKNQIPPNGDEH